MTKNKLHPLALGLSVGIISGLAALFTSFLAYVVFNGKPIVSMVGTMYVTYNPTLINGILVGFVTFIGALIAGYITAGLYNFILDNIVK